MGRAAGNEMVPVRVLEKRWGQWSSGIKEKKGFICGCIRAGVHTWAMQKGPELGLQVNRGSQRDLTQGSGLEARLGEDERRAGGQQRALNRE